MDKYYFIYSKSSGKIEQTYLGNAEKWENIPESLDVIGPFVINDAIAMDVFDNSDCYNVTSGTLTPVQDIETIKAKKEADKLNRAQLPTLDEQVKQMQEAFNMLMMEGL